MLLFLNGHTTHLVLVPCFDERLASLAAVDDKAAVLTERGKILLVLGRKIVVLNFVNGHYDTKHPGRKIIQISYS